MVETIEIGQTSDEQFTVTMRGDPQTLVHILAHGAGHETLLALKDAVDRELIQRRERALKPPTE